MAHQHGILACTFVNEMNQALNGPVGQKASMGPQRLVVPCGEGKQRGRLHAAHQGAGETQVDGAEARQKPLKMLKGQLPAGNRQGPGLVAQAFGTFWFRLTVSYEK